MRCKRIAGVVGGFTTVLLTTVSLTASPSAAASQAPAVTGVAGHELHVMTFNLRYASDTPPNSWPERRRVMQQLLQQERPDIIGTQEGLDQQLRDIQSDLPAYHDSIGQGRDGGSKGEAMQIFCDSRPLRPLEYAHYWLSDTPDIVGSKTWGGCCPRMVTWIRLGDERTGEQFYLLNTHLEAFDATARSKSADLILQRMAQDFDPALPVLMTGDFNEPARQGRTVYGKLVTDGPMVDSWVTAKDRSALYATFHGYRPTATGSTGYCRRRRWKRDTRRSTPSRSRASFPAITCRCRRW